MAAEALAQWRRARFAEPLALMPYALADARRKGEFAYYELKYSVPGMGICTVDFAKRRIYGFGG